MNSELYNGWACGQIVQTKRGWIAAGSRMVVELVVEVIKSCVGLEGVYKGTTVS